MKKIEAIIKRSNYPVIVSELNKMGYSIIERRNLEDSKIFEKHSSSKISSNIIKIIPLSKIELVVSEKDARNVINLISKQSGFSGNTAGKIFISEMEEIVDLGTLNAQQDLESDEIYFSPKSTIKRSRLVPLQKFTRIKLEKIYEINQEKLQINFRIKSFSDFVNYCIMGYLPTMEQQLKQSSILYENNFRDF